jgi:hypothetical protein
MTYPRPDETFSLFRSISQVIWAKDYPNQDGYPGYLMVGKNGEEVWMKKELFEAFFKLEGSWKLGEMHQ